MKTTKTRSTFMSRARTASASLAAAALAAFTATAATMTQLINGPSDIRVAPLVEASWAQGKVGGSPCYNSKTPENCLCGCVATAAGQIMRKWQYPTAAAKKVTNTLSVNGVSGTYTMLGGPGVSYDWANMPFNPANEANLTDAQRNAIGTLLYDIGVAAEMTYTTSSSATSTSRMFEQFTETFGYSNAAIVGNPAGTGLSLEQFTQAILPSLDAGMPVMVGIGGANTAHSVLCDGYGYQDGDLYIHINMGQGNNDTDNTKKFNNAWYKFATNNPEDNGVSLWPGTDGTGGEQSYLNPAIYNISPTMPKGASIISGRIFSDATDSTSLQGATVVALNTSGAEVATATSDAKGIYALILPAGTYTLRAMTSDETKGARRLVTVVATAGTRSGATATGVVIGNRHGVDFHLIEDGSAVLAAGLLTDYFVEYVEAADGQYFDTGVIGKPGTKFQTKFMFATPSGTKTWTSLIGSYGNGSNFMLRFDNVPSRTVAEGHACLNLAFGSVNNRGQWPWLLNEVVYDANFEYTTGNAISFVAEDGEGNKKTSTASGANAVDTGKNMYYFARNNNGTADCFCPGRCYGLTIWQVPDGGTDYVLVRNFIPCVRDGRPGLYDAVSHEMFYSLAGGDFSVGSVVTPVELTHRWSFTSDYSDSVGDADAAVTGGSGVSVSDGKAVLVGGFNAGYLNIGSNVLGSGDATLEVWYEKLDNAGNSWSSAFSYGKDSQNLFTVNTGFGYDWETGGNTGSQYAPVDMIIGGTGYGSSNRIGIKPLLPNHLQHVSVTFKRNTDGSTTVRWMSRDAVTGFLLMEFSNTVPSWTLADASDFSLRLGRSHYSDRTYDRKSRFDEVRVWNGVLTDEQLSANVLAGPDATFTDGIVAGFDGMVVTPGEMFEVNGKTGGYGYWTDKCVTLRTGAKIRFNTTDYFGTGLRFRAGGFVLPVGETDLLSFVELDDTENYTVSLENANTILVQLKDAIPHTSTWTGATPSSAADLSNAANWTSVNAKGVTIAAAPTAKTTAVIPAETLATFTLPSGVSVNWGRVLLGGYTKTQWGRLTPADQDQNVITFRDRQVSDYNDAVVNGEQEISKLNWTSTNGPAELNASQLRFDGWINVSAAQAGRWDVRCCYFDMIAFAIDGEWQFMHNTRRYPITAGSYVSEGWHRFTLVVRDITSYGGYGAYTSLNGIWYPFVLSVNGGAEIGCSQLTFGTGATTVALSGDANWAGLGPVFMESGLTVDLNGNNLTVAALDGDFVSTVFKNTSATASTLYTYTGTVGTGVLTDNLTVSKLPVATAEWTNAAGDNDASNPANWTCKDSSGNVLDGALPTSDTTTTVNKLPTATLSGASAAFASANLKVGDASRGEFLQENGTVTLGQGHIANVAAGSGLYAMSNGTLTVTGDFEVGPYGTGEFVQSGGTSTFNSWFNAGRHAGGNGTITVNGGTLTQTLDNDDTGRVYLGVAGGTGTLNVGGTGVVSLWKLILGCEWNNGATKSYLNVRDDGELILRDALWVGYNSSLVDADVVQDGGKVSVVNSVRLAENAGSHGTYTLNGGVMKTTYWLHVGVGGTGAFVQNGGDAIAEGRNNNWLSVGYSAGSTSTYVMNNGLLRTQNGICLGNGGGTGTFTLNGGTVVVPTIKDNKGTSAAVLNGGTIKVSADGTILDKVDNLVFGNGTTIDTDGHDTSITGCGYSANSGSSLVKAGAGTLTAAMPPVNTLTVSNGVFALSAAADNNIAGRTLEVASGATVNLGGNALTQPVIAGAGTVQNGTLTVTEKIRVNAGKKLTFTGVALDLTGTTVEVADTDNLSTAFVFAESGTEITGKPASGVKGWKVKKSADGKTLTLAKVKGMMIIAK